MSRPPKKRAGLQAKPARQVSAATDYAERVLSGEIVAPRLVRLACERHLRDLTREDLWYDESAAERFYEFSRTMRHYKGPMKGRPIELSPWQKFLFGNIYGWKRVVDGVRSDLWRYHYVYVEVPRKNGKTTTMAIGAAYDAGFVEESGAEVYCLATRHEQAMILYKDVRAFIKGSPDLEEEFEILEGRNTIYAQGSNRTSWIQPLSSNAERQDGYNPIAAYCDELHQWPDRQLLDALEDAFAARENWHIISITTAGYDRHGVCYAERTHSVEILERKIEKDDKFALIFHLDKEEIDRPFDEDVWFKANPELGQGKSLTYMRSKAEKAAQIPSELTSFLTKHLNVWTDAVEIWLPTEKWSACSAKFSAQDLAGLRCWVGVDLAKVLDLSAVAYFFPVQRGLAKPRLFVDFFIPEENLRDRVKRDRVQYDVWLRQGWLRTTPGNTTDFRFIEAAIRERAKLFSVQAIGFDRFFAGEIINNLAEDGFEILDIGQGFATMSAPTVELERLAVSAQIEHDGNPVLAWCIGNVATIRDPAGNIKPDKSRAQERIDGAVASIMALAASTMQKSEKKPPSPYESRGMRSL